ncbi:MAG TPA: hypothetical protein PLQ93_04525 [Bacteroidia bacterium]|nr:hypothetical protein [Bacteroidia bacterium]
MKRVLIVLTTVFLFTGWNQAQVDSVYYGTPAKHEKTREKEKAAFNWKEKLSFGGNFMVMFGSSTYVYLSPTVNMAVNKRLYVGAGIVYNYTSYYYLNSKVSYSIYGLHCYSMLFLTKNVFGKVEFDRLLQPNYFSYNYNDKVWVNYIYVGGGLRQPLGDRAAMYASIMYNLNKSPQAIFYPNPIIQIGIFAGF